MPPSLTKYFMRTILGNLTGLAISMSRVPPSRSPAMALAPRNGVARKRHMVATTQNWNSKNSSRHSSHLKCEMTTIEMSDSRNNGMVSRHSFQKSISELPHAKSYQAPAENCRYQENLYEDIDFQSLIIKDLLE